MNKEQVYDAQINPLMAEIINICQRHGIAMFCTFAIPTEADPNLQCTTIMPDGDGKHPHSHPVLIAVMRSSTDIDQHARPE